MVHKCDDAETLATQPNPGQEQGMDNLPEQIAAKQARLDRLRIQVPNGLENLEHVHDLELTYTSNAIEGNTLTAAETTLVVEIGHHHRRQAAQGPPGSDRSS